MTGGELAGAVQEAWWPLARHAEGHEPCAEVARELAAVPDDPWPLWDRLCDAAQALYLGWADAKAALVAHLQELNAPWGMAGLRGVEAERRAAALTRLGPAGAADIWTTADLELREAKIAGVIAASQRPVEAPGVSGGGGGGQEVECAFEGCDTGPYGTRARFVPPAGYPSKRYCCQSCRKRAASAVRERPSLMETE